MNLRDTPNCCKRREENLWKYFYSAKVWKNIDVRGACGDHIFDRCFSSPYICCIMRRYHYYVLTFVFHYLCTFRNLVIGHHFRTVYHWFTSFAILLVKPKTNFIFIKIVLLQPLFQQQQRQEKFLLVNIFRQFQLVQSQRLSQLIQIRYINQFVFEFFTNERLKEIPNQTYEQRWMDDVQFFQILAKISIQIFVRIP